MEEENKVERKDRSEIIPGIILVVLGLLFLLPRLGLDFGKLWPTFVLAPGLALGVFYLSSANKKDKVGLMIPTTILILLSAFFYYMSAVSWKGIDLLWPVFSFVVGVSLYVFYFMNEKKSNGAFIAANILVCFSILFLALNLISYNFWPLILIIVGIYFILRSKK